ncbi:uncharacterized protein [Oryza sativa Japonica Group]|uniref:Os06g0201500 protein n=2 Tax=Oryza sativa subsp. japonica TaxID=39947 RepID=A0A0P0WU83_ORYSJ|nr:uncharacterized protein LOC107278564 [Oryza sativa Japonica Group]KAB8101636.1 hypothetical protein EE612_032513 [Oryza sativa]EAZ36172.1 hypothetical protein OsJ_20484 [Oryza sativa Japonica Group]KAF2925682.1 hypothetical protein DAI22_06g070900 [Oryza sativa Japonica Group]BAD35593.1 hypothetical protein [Oryza sativa Japonica Group]BAS96658.1 Os06g0201500 [Oryza sativa Japonica Group]
MASDVAMAIVLSLGCAVVGGPEVLRVLLGLSGRSLVDDVAICVFVLGAVTAPVLGNMLLARYVRVVRGAAAAAAAPHAPAVDPFARVTVAVALAVALVVAACLILVVPSSAHSASRDPGSGAA